MKKLFSFICFIFISTIIYSQSCSILSKANNITPDKLCSPVSVIWNVSYTGVDDGGTSVEIKYDWDDGHTQTTGAVIVGPGIYEATLSHVYTSQGNVCNYHPQATLVVNGVLCTSSAQEQIVTVWDDDNHNGGHMHINPTVYPICVGNSDNVRFQDLTQFNCVPPQENDVPNLFTRWIQWIYGTDITMTGILVTINGAATVFPYSAPVITLPGPVTGSGVYSDIINVANDKLVGQYFQVTLRNWNYCNPYDDPNIAGPPADPINGDYPPVTTTAIILIVPYPDATINPVSNQCLDAPKVTLTAHDSGGTWSGPGVSGNKFNPSSAGVGTHTITYSITSASGCTDSDQTTITVFPVPDATITPVGPQCFNNPAVTLVAHDPGGTWAGSGLVGNTFDPSVAGIGNHIISYSITNIDGCTSTDQITITVDASPDATINPVGNFCQNASQVTLTAHDPGGTWAGSGVIGDIFDPAAAGPGVHTISYTITTAGGCTDNDQINITVFPSPDATITPVGPLCSNEPVVTLQAHDPGGTWTGPGVAGNIFNPSASGTGDHTINYTITNINGCTSSDQITITVNSSPDATISPVGDLCTNAPQVTLTAHDTGGTWSGPGVTGNIFDPAAAGAGTHTISYTISTGSCNDNDQINITVLSAPDATITPVGILCFKDPPVLLTAHDPGGTWTGPGLVGNIFNPASAGIGTHTITYTILNINGCTDTDQISITVDASPDATITPVSPMCIDNPPVTVTTHDPGGILSGNGLTGNIFNPALAGVGSHIITHTIVNANCSSSDQITIIVSPKPDASITRVGNICVNVPKVNLIAADPGGIWSGDGVVGSIFDPVLAGIGTHLIKYNITNVSGCSDSDSIAIRVEPKPDATIIPVDTLCVNHAAIVISTNEIGGVWSGAVSDEIFDPSVLGVGDHIINYRIIDNNGCRDSDRINISVMPIPLVSIIPVGPFYLNSPSETLSATPTGGIFSGDGMSGKVFNPGTAGLGIHVIKYQTIPDRFGCLGSDTIHIKVTMPPLPVSIFQPDTVGCSPLKVQFVNKSVNAESYLWDFGDKVISTEKNPAHTYYTPGNYIVTLTVTNISGQSVHTHEITVFQNPTAVFNVYPTEVTNSAQIVVITNYSTNDDYRLWKFGDGTTSSEDNPWHKFESEGTFIITLIATTKNGCVDSTNFSSPVHVKFSVGKIKFPNAFVWNRSGPNGGYWEEGDVDDRIFRPHFENVLEYKLQIFNRWGVLIYESIDLHKGWDGYFGSGFLALEGVYVWKAVGRFVDGKYFDEVGDVTFLH